MRGNPIKEWIIFSALWLLLLIPVLRLTAFRKGHETIVSQDINDYKIETAKAVAIFRYTDTPVFIRVNQNDRTLCDLAVPPSGETEKTFPILIEDSSAELLIQAEWTDEKKHAFEIELIVDDKNELKRYFWAEKTLDEIVSFRW